MDRALAALHSPGRNLHSPGLSLPPAAPLAFSRDGVRRQRWLDELATLLAFPTVSSSPARRGDIVAAAEWLAAHLRHLGLHHVAILSGPQGSSPSVYADWLHAPGQPTVLLYGHFDVQPPGPLHDWHTPPFRASRVGDSLVARGASDDKGQLFIHLKAIESYLATGALPINVKVWLEGEEEIGSPHLPAFLDRHLPRLRADAVLISDTEMSAFGQPAIIYGLRGNLVADIAVHGPARELHSGRYGGAIRNPVQVLCEMIASLHDAEGRIAIPGFYDTVQPVGPEERQALRRNGPSGRQMLAQMGVEAGWGEPGYSLYERTTLRPALIVQQVTGGGRSAAIPGRACARLGIRLVPDQEPPGIARQLDRYIMALAPPSLSVRVTCHAGVWPVVVPRRHPLAQAAARAVRSVWGVPPAFLRSGGSISAASQFHRRLHVPVILLGFGLPDDRIHGSDEKLNLAQFFQGVETVIQFLAECAR